MNGGQLDDIDRALIVATQGGLPLVARPYQLIAGQLGLSADDVMRRLKAMLDSGIIRRIGVVPNHYAIGWTANGMTVWDVADDRVDELGEAQDRVACGVVVPNDSAPGSVRWILSPTATVVRARCRPGRTTCLPWCMALRVKSVRSRRQRLALYSAMPARRVTSSTPAKS